MATKKKKAKASKPANRGARAVARKKPRKLSAGAKKAPAKKAKAPKKKVERAATPMIAKTAKGRTKAPKAQAPKAQAPKAHAPKTQGANARASKTFAQMVGDRDAGTPVWFITAGGVEHASIQSSGGAGAVVIRTDAGVTEVVPVSNIFETADEARAARY